MKFTPGALLLAALVVPLVGCTSNHHARTQPAPPPPSQQAAPGLTAPDAQTVTVTGRVISVGGPAPGLARPAPGGSVIADGAKGTHDFGALTIVQTDAAGRFKIQLHQGLYLFRAGFPQPGSANCASGQPVTVSDKDVTGVDVICDLD